MSILSFIFSITKIKLTKSINIYEYCRKYPKVFDAVCSLIAEKCKLLSKNIQMVLIAGFFTGMGD